MIVVGGHLCKRAKLSHHFHTLLFRYSSQIRADAQLDQIFASGVSLSAAFPLSPPSYAFHVVAMKHTFVLNQTITGMDYL
jgi:hypothetical protein